MLSNLNEKYLLKFISSVNAQCDCENCSLIELLNSFGVKIVLSDENPVYDIINKMEYCGICYE